VKVLVVGASGFIGQGVSAALEAAGCEVVRCSTAARRPGEIACDYARDVREEDWLPRLCGTDAVVNAAGLFRASERSLAQVHDAGPRALFAACERAGVRRVVQISALGADAAATTAFHRSKRRADDALRSSALDWIIVQPSIVLGAGGASARRFAMLASLPLVPLPGAGMQRVQPIDLGDLCALVVRTVIDRSVSNVTVAAVGPRALTVRELLQAMRMRLRLGRAHFIPIPLSFVRMGVGREAVSMLERGNTAPADPAERLVGRPLRQPAMFLGPDDVLRAKLDWLLPLLRASVALTWIVTAIVSLAYPRVESLALLEKVGLTGPYAPTALYGAAALDFGLGAGIYALRPGPRRWLWRGQLALIAGYSAIIAIFLPEFWLHPFGPLLKNVPLMAAILLLHELERSERWST
jgi:uncharacterized protein YbjT (DUF2867 family)